MPRDGTKNLIPFNKLTEEKQKEMARQGGIKSGESRRQKRLLRDSLEDILYSKSSDGKLYLDEMTMSLFKKALDGDVKAFEVVRDTIGQKPTENVKAEIELPVFKNDLDE